MEKRWCILTDKLPLTVRIGDQDYPIDTRTSTALNCIRKLREDIPEEAKAIYVLARMGLSGSVEAFAAIVDFLAGPPADDDKQHVPGPPSFDYFQDAKLISAAFQQAYGLGLDEITSMHWWRFLSLLEGIPGDTRFMEIIGVRTMEINPKDSAETKAKKRKAKLAVALKDTRTEAEKQRDVQRQLNNLGL